ncbi:protein of unknown function (plasmid) [Methylocella tundrae]|uniref:Uncharacterized protein n=1 Tax=Methylocella tundrae TaxID=227605 RepID=A0A4U8Z6Z2_METTU|nr:protein of unknown function [Methylocella tundrae]
MRLICHPDTLAGSHMLTTGKPLRELRSCVKERRKRPTWPATRLPCATCATVLFRTYGRRRTRQPSGYEEFTRDLIDPIPEEAAKLCEGFFIP